MIPACMILMAGARDPEHVSSLMADAGAPGWTVIPAFGGWTDPDAPKGAPPMQEPSHAVFLLGVSIERADAIAEYVRIALRQSEVHVVPFGLAGPVRIARGALPNGRVDADPIPAPVASPDSVTVAA